MTENIEQKEARLERLAGALGPHIAWRGVLQYFCCGAVLPNQPMSVAELREHWRALGDGMRAGKVPDLLCLYVHVPFCPHKCRYCIYYSEPGALPKVVDAYLDRVHAEIDYLKHVFRGLTFGTWYIGGGSPTLLSERQLDKLIRHMDEAFPRRAGHQSAFECSPLTITAEKAALFKKHGFNRVSFGVQTVRRGVLSRAGRGYQTPAMVKRAFTLLKRGGFWINADLLYGLTGDSIESMGESVRAVLAEHPDQVTLYDVSPCTPGASVRARRRPLDKLAIRVAPIAARAGYTYSVSPTCIEFRWKMPARQSFSYDYSDMTAEPYSLVGIGPTVRFYLWGALRASYVQYPVNAAFDPSAREVMAQVVTRGEEQRRFVIHSLEERGALDPKAFGDLFGPLEASEVAATVGALVRTGRLRRKNGFIVHALRSARARFVTMLHFVDEAMLAGAERRVRQEAAGGVGRSDSLITLAYGRHSLTVAVDTDVPGAPCAHRYGGFCFLIPVKDGEKLVMGEVESDMLAAFGIYFDQVVRSERPASVRQLSSLLVKRQGKSPVGGITATSG